ncbi:ArnT family glycosyltransferase [Actibacterium lipolyticum]|uniref:Glycosyltransferase RgtA/B/C/D-like domain-containing protein n=1 Tax=Actibacterium lipolyticum TaxID=1524263 RepID=A0A238JMZ4_9RHOB|nr:glycosyltransferase family 39 protein [Actibacterium lipolyticum]SMX31262.1 hypothetical protein COL8621_00359 [Actibacterium lipolyticum]
MVTPSSPQARRVTAVFLAAITLYFAAQIVLRLVLGGALETDEAEMMVMTPGFQLGYGPQLPLYNWLQVALSAVFGKSLFALAILKNTLLWLTYLLVFLGLRLWVPASLAAIGALSLFILPDVAWEAQRATTHSNMLLATCAATLAAFLWVLKSGRWAAYVALGVAIGLGGLAKYNFWLVPVGLFVAGVTVEQLRPRLIAARTAVVPVIAAAIVALPYAWMFQNPTLAFSSTSKLAMEEVEKSFSFDGLIALIGAMAILAVLPALVAAGIYLFNRRHVSDAINPANLTTLLWRASALLAAVLVVGVAAAGVGHITPRWLLPLFFLAVPALFIDVFGRLNGHGQRAFSVVVAVIAVAVLVGLAFDRNKPTARRAVDFTGLPAQLQEIAPMNTTPVIAEFFVAGNLARQEPDWRVAPYLGFAGPDFAGETVLFLFRKNIPPNLRAGMRQTGWPEGAEGEILQEGRIILPYDSGPEKMLKLDYKLVKTPALP